MGDTVTFSFGAYAIAEPHLRGLKAVQACLTPEDYETIAEMIQEAGKRRDAAREAGGDGQALGPDDVLAFAKLALPLLSHAAEAAEAFLWACLRTADGGAVKDRVTQDAVPSDLVKFWAAAKAQRIFDDLSASLGNVFRPAQLATV